MGAGIAAALVIFGAASLESRPDFNPVIAMAETLMAGYGLAGEAARLRAAQMWRPRWAGGSSRTTWCGPAAWRRSRWRRCGMSWPGLRAGWAPRPGLRRPTPSQHALSRPAARVKTVAPPLVGTNDPGPWRPR